MDETWKKHETDGDRNEKSTTASIDRHRMLHFSHGVLRRRRGRELLCRPLQQLHLGGHPRVRIRRRRPLQFPGKDGPDTEHRVGQSHHRTDRRQSPPSRSVPYLERRMLQYHAGEEPDMRPEGPFFSHRTG